MQAYNKLIAASVGLLVLLGTNLGLDLSAQQDSIVQIVVAVLTAFWVYQVENKVST